MVVPGLWPAAAVHSDSSSSGGEGARAPYIISIHLHLHSVGPGTSSGWLAVTKKPRWPLGPNEWSAMHLNFHFDDDDDDDHNADDDVNESKSGWAGLQ